MFNFIFTSSRGPIIIKHGGGGWRTLEDHMIFGGKGRQRLKGGGGVRKLYKFTANFKTANEWGS